MAPAVILVATAEKKHKKKKRRYSRRTASLSRLLRCNWLARLRRSPSVQPDKKERKTQCCALARVCEVN
ncbi:general transcription factor 3C polypeptide 1 [Tachysurus ichikawai]